MGKLGGYGGTVGVGAALLALALAGPASADPHLGDFKVSVEGVQTTKGTISTKPDQDGDGVADCPGQGAWSETVRFKTRNPARISAAYPGRLVFQGIGRGRRQPQRCSPQGRSSAPARWQG